MSLGAGLDSVAWRHTDLDLEVVEADQPDSAADKLRRVRAADPDAVELVTVARVP